MWKPRVRKQSSIYLLWWAAASEGHEVLSITVKDKVQRVQ